MTSQLDHPINIEFIPLVQQSAARSSEALRDANVIACRQVPAACWKFYRLLSKFWICPRHVSCVAAYARHECTINLHWQLHIEQWHGVCSDMQGFMACALPQ